MDIGTYDEVPKPKDEDIECVIRYEPCEYRVGRTCTNLMELKECKNKLNIMGCEPNE